MALVALQNSAHRKNNEIKYKEALIETQQVGNFFECHEINNLNQNYFTAFKIINMSFEDITGKDLTKPLYEGFKMYIKRKGIINNKI